MKERFEDKDAGNLIVALKRQELVAGDKAIAEAIVKAGELLDFGSGTAIIVEDTVEDDVFFLISGSVAIVVKGNQIHTRYAGQHVGEMPLSNPHNVAQQL